MKSFSSLDLFAQHIKKVTRKYPEKEKQVLNLLGHHLEKVAKEKIGHLQDQQGPFAEWEELAESTKLDKENKGYVFNADYNPLYRTGALQDSITYSVIRSTLRVGSNDEIAIYQELGTINIPPRSFLGATFYQEHKAIKATLGSFLLNWITDRQLLLSKR